MSDRRPDAGDVAVEDRLLELFRERGHRAGDRLPTEVDIAQALGLSRPKVREGLLSLERQGVLRSRQGSGRVLLDRTHHSLPALLAPAMGHSGAEIVDAVVVRQALETGFLPAAVELIDDGALAAMQAAIDDMAARIEAAEPFQGADRAFHDALFSRVGNQLLSALFANFWELLATIDPLTIPHREAASETLEHHRRILEAIRAHDVELAQLHMNRHFYDSVESLRDLTGELTSPYSARR
jgi:GntR family transcriptional repressor for pyruvate dehydrogenase complex